MDTGLGKDEAVLGADVVAGPLEVLTDVDSTADEVVELFWKCWSKTIGTEDADNLAAGNKTNCTNGMAITKEITDLRWANTLLGVITDSLDALLRGHLEPVWSCTTVREGRAGDTLSIAVESSHLLKADQTVVNMKTLKIQSKNNRFVFNIRSSL